MKVSGSNPVNLFPSFVFLFFFLFLFFFFDQEINSLKHVFAFGVSSVLFYLGLYYYCIIIFFFFKFYSFCNILFSSFRYNSAKLSRSLQCLNRWIRPRIRSFLGKLLRTTGSCTSSIAMSICHYCVQYQGRYARSFPTRLLGCCYRLHGFARQVSDVSNHDYRVKVSPGNEILGPCYEL